MPFCRGHLRNGVQNRAAISHRSAHWLPCTCNRHGWLSGVVKGRCLCGRLHGTCGRRPCRPAGPASRRRLHRPVTPVKFANDFAARRNNASSRRCRRRPAVSPASGPGSWVSSAGASSVHGAAPAGMVPSATWRRRRQLAGRPAAASAVRPPLAGGWPPMAPLAVASSVLAFLLFYNTLDADFAYDDR